MANLGWPLVGALVTAGVIAAALLRGLLASRWSAWGLDQPNHRSLHTRPTPRWGGIALLTGMTVAAWAWGAIVPLGLMGAVALLVLVSWLDDLRDLPAWLRLPVHGLVSGIAVQAVGPDWAWSTWLLASVALTWTINLYNFMDGLDGLAGGQTVLGFATYALAAAQAGHAPLALTGSAIVGAALGFLIYNLPPARVFMGDAGSTSLGLLAGALGLWGIHEALWPVWWPLLAFMPYWVDATLTLLLRTVRGERIWEAHRQHAYQRLRLMGLGAATIAGVYHLLMGACAALALLAQRQGWGATPAWVALGMLVIGYGAVLRVTSRRAALPRSPAC